MISIPEIANYPKPFEEKLKPQRRAIKSAAVHQSEKDVIDELQRRGIPAVPGKALDYKWTDLVAWGCLPIEVKSSHINKGRFDFKFTELQRNVRLRGEIIILVCYYDDKVDFHLFPANHSAFYNKATGKLYEHVIWIPNRESSLSSNSLTDHLMNWHRNSWILIETHRIEHSKRLREQAIQEAV